MSPITETKLMTNILTINLPNYAQKLTLDFSLSNDDLRKAFLLPHSVTFEPYPSEIPPWNYMKILGIHRNPWNS